MVRDISSGGSEGVKDDAVRAKKAGVSYGKFKAGLKKKKHVSEYTVSTGGFLTPSEKQSGAATSCAFIKRT